MIDLKLEANIKNTKEFIELWTKFHQIFEKTISEPLVNNEKEAEFASVRKLLNSRFEDLMDSLDIKPLKRFVMCTAICNILALEELSNMSDEKMKNFNTDWDESSKFLYGILDRLNRKKNRIGDFNKFAFVIKRKINFRRKG
ncbi:MAG: hypothetical protein ABIH57_01385 [Candidatus Omnitrophota bacterium]